MITPAPDILSFLVEKAHVYQTAARTGDANIAYRTLTEIERFAAYHKTKMTRRMVIDPTETDDDEL